MKQLADAAETEQRFKSQTVGKAYALLSQGAGPAVIAATYLAMAVWTWRKWPDLLVDFGRELYVPWQLVTGKVLYTDIAYFNGPFSPYLNALWFRLFGVSLTTLIFANLAILASVTCLIYIIFKAVCDRLTATMSSLALLTVFAFAQYVFIGNYNFVCPYAHDLTHGIALTVGMICALSRYALRRQLGTSIIAGLLLGLVFLTKAEVFLAAAAAALIGMALLYISGQSSGHQTRVVLFAFGGSTCVPIVLFFAFLWTQMPAMQALHGIAGTWTSLLGSKVSNNLFYQYGLGIDRPWTNLALMMRMVAAVILLAGAVVLADISRSLHKGWKLLSCSTSVLLFAAALLVKQAAMPLLMLGQALPFITMVAGAVITVVCIKQRTERNILTQLAPLAMWAAFAFVLLGKIILNARLYHYGFALAMPATLLLVICLVWLAPRALHRLYGGGDLFRRVAVVMIVADILFYLGISNSIYRHKGFTVGADGDAIITYDPRMHPMGGAVAQALRSLTLLMPPNANFVVLPEGVMLNYLSRHPNPTPYHTFNPVELTIFGEATILDSFKARPPDFILLVHKDTREYGTGYFGAGPSYGRQIIAWVDSHYETIERILDEPLKDEYFGIKILKRRM